MIRRMTRLIIRDGSAEREWGSGLGRIFEPVGERDSSRRTVTGPIALGQAERVQPSRLPAD